MIKVAICDTDTSTQKQIRNVADQIPEIRQCDWYPEPASLARMLEQNSVSYQIILSSLEWKCGKDWVGMVQELRGLCPTAKMVYMAEHPERFVQQVFTREILPVAFLIKPLEQKTVTECFAHLIGEMRPGSGGGLLIRRRGRIQSIDFQEIVYLESVGHLIVIRTKTGEYDCYGCLQKLKEQLPEDFVQCHKSYVVNMRRVCKIEGRWITVENGDMIPISKSRHQMTRKHYMNSFERTQTEMEAGGK
ncbi:MAG: LytTR family transcriptional regulator DNA-binding domain-containing protein [Clostridiales bacterium]|nr:LytTR family transcriptional regulator DNA-binding domain-containing protein [Clostridiales bacterium]